MPSMGPNAISSLELSVFGMSKVLSVSVVLAWKINLLEFGISGILGELNAFSLSPAFLERVWRFWLQIHIFGKSSRFLARALRFQLFQSTPCNFFSLKVILCCRTGNHFIIFWCILVSTRGRRFIGGAEIWTQYPQFPSQMP